MSNWSKVLVAISSLLLIGLFVFPLWRVRLTAPQYPEGLGLNIRINTVEGATETDLNNINGLNKYIGMKRIDPETIPELRFMPWIVGGLVVSGLAVAAAARRRILYVWLAGSFAWSSIAIDTRPNAPRFSEPKRLSSPSTVTDLVCISPPWNSAMHTPASRSSPLCGWLARRASLESTRAGTIKVTSTPRSAADIRAMTSDSSGTK